MNTRQKLVHYLAGRFTIGEITQLTSDRLNFVTYYGVRSRGVFLSNQNGQYKFDTKEEAMTERARIKEWFKRKLRAFNRY